MKRIFDITLSLFALIILSIPMVFISLIVLVSSKGSILHWSDRVGKNGKIFTMPKFRSMLIHTPAMATHLLDNPDSYLTLCGGFLRRYSLDELPQLFSILKGEMSFVGPRPALYNQDDLITLRIHKGVDKLLPGITGWAQINGRDELSISEKVALDLEYLNNYSFYFDLKILWLTLIKVIKSDGVSH